MRSRELDSMILMSPFQLEILSDSVTGRGRYEKMHFSIPSFCHALVATLIIPISTCLRLVSDYFLFCMLLHNRDGW